MHDRECDFADLVAALHWGSLSESEFRRRMLHQHNLDEWEVDALIVEAREREAGNG